MNTTTACRSLALAIAIAIAITPCATLAQKTNLGAYEGTASVAYSETSDKTKHEYEGTVKIRIPLTNVSASSAMAELDGAGNVGSIRITKYDYEQEATAKGLDGKLMRVTCKLAAPVELPVTASGTFDMDYRKKQYAMYLVLSPSKSVTVNCVNSQSGPYKDTKGVALFLATYVPHGTRTMLPYADPAQLTAKYSLTDPVLKQQYSPIVQTWDLKLVK